MSPSLIVLLVNLGATLYMTGLIWFVQVVHYPLFAFAGEDGFETYAYQHVRRTQAVVALPMLVELLTGILLCFVGPPGVPRWMPLVGVALLAVIWVSTTFVSVPRHAHLAGGLDLETVRSLVATNWVRTAAWTARALLCFAMLAIILR